MEHNLTPSHSVSNSDVDSHYKGLVEWLEIDRFWECVLVEAKNSTVASVWLSMFIDCDERCNSINVPSTA